jgi:hypothetical protein
MRVRSSGCNVPGICDRGGPLRPHPRQRVNCEFYPINHPSPRRRPGPMSSGLRMAVVIRSSKWNYVLAADCTRRRRSGPHPAPRLRILDVAFDPRVPLFRRPAAVMPVPEPQPQRDDTVSATSLCRRLAAIRRALSDLPREARRYARWRAKPVAARHPKLGSMLRPGPPPCLRRTSNHQVHAILSECHWLARTVLAGDTS